MNNNIIITENDNIIITENDKEFIHKHKWDNTTLIKKGETTNLFIIKCPPNKKIEIRNTNKITFNIKDENGIEIPDYTKISIKKVEPSIGVWFISRIIYYDLRLGYQFKQNIELNEHQYLEINIHHSEVNIPKENISFKIETNIIEP